MTTSYLASIRHFLTEDIWKANTEELHPLKRMGYHTLKIAMLTVRQIGNDHILDRAASITYTTLFSIIPILALLFAIANGFGFGNILREQMRENSMIIDQQYDMVFSLIDSYLNHAQNGIFIGAGIIMLFVSVYFLSSDIENHVNAIWQSQNPRPLMRLISDYFSMIFVIPVVMIAMAGISIFMSTYIEKAEGFLILGPLVKFFISMIPYCVTCCVFMGMYIFVPNTHVKFRHVIIPGILAGSVFQAFQFFYINSQLWLSNYNAIYGSFAAIPFFLMWANVSWAICLTGVEISYLSQNLSAFGYDLGQKKISRLNHDYVAVIIMSLLCKRQEERNKWPYTARELSKEIKLPLRLTQTILNELMASRLILSVGFSKLHGDPTGYVAYVNEETATVEFVLNVLDNYREVSYLPDTEKYGKTWERVKEVRQKLMVQQGQTKLKEL